MTQSANAAFGIRDDTLGKIRWEFQTGVERAIQRVNEILLIVEFLTANPAC